MVWYMGLRPTIVCIVLLLGPPPILGTNHLKLFQMPSSSHERTRVCRPTPDITRLHMDKMQENPDSLPPDLLDSQSRIPSV